MATRRSVRMSNKRLKLRQQYWPDITEEDLWLRSETKGFATIPRGLSLIMRIMDALSPQKPLANTYMALWCYVFDEMSITIHKPRQMALESGFTGQRAEYTWRDRMKKIEELGFIRSSEGFSGVFHNILLLNPYYAVKLLNEDKNYDVPAALYNTLLDRIDEIGETTIMIDGTEETA
ncbi:MAG: hypothetical protein HGB26_01655 [Desulfobulbaceae bacterium]|nr:hypothetical protein [Desulfobulbaceae bacterium]